ncbi:MULTISPECIES: RNA polymerase sigma factor [Streptomyces]|uniref:Sigma-70 family RNA polymerase sigma factor n=1 Tax=Streptomyces rutgersensis TaxID=53451 RepID=A0ABX6RYM7_9ACTN|nr:MULTISPECIES: RNA polymerase sigma factor [Streptomyces]NEE25525.1 RNA polymerase sigma factor [Streptomyces sp. SID7982]NEE57258.1 RNA polymerase sigma factor [Streptomyces sp. SID8455]PJM83464.1 RNA polymerase subunit sigma-24 [Streptomyces sp. TSRI0384-2]QNE84914.1 sigma-70 family RNA polymerase sigma factor [Streptomyces rutgersensis]WPR54789.1 RNA polymerase sigma factor [Streptomyces sp. S399]
MGAPEENDAALLRAVAAGDPAALARLYDRHAGWLQVRLSRRCADPETVGEVLQDTFVTVWRSAGAHRGGEAGGWLWTIAARRLVDASRARARAERYTPAPAPSAPSAEDHVLDALEYGDMGTALRQLGPELRDVLRATVVDGLTTREAAVLLGIPEGTVKSRARRARRELRAALARVAGRPGDPPPPITAPSPAPPRPLGDPA